LAPAERDSATGEVVRKAIDDLIAANSVE